MNINTISYLVADSFHTMRKDIKNELISLGTILATMILIAVAFIVYMNANSIIDTNKDESSNILAYLEIGLSDEKVQNIRMQIEDIPGVTQKNGVEFRSVEDSIKRVEKMSKALLAGYTQEEKEQIIQPYFIVKFDDVAAVPGIMANLAKIEGIGNEEEDIEIDDGAVKAQKDAKIAKVISITVMILIVEFSVFLMMNTTKLMMYAKRREISIMKYVGARDNFIKAPFAIQGVITGLIGVAITMLLVAIFYPIVATSADSLGSGYAYVDYSEISSDLFVILLIIAFVIGIVGSSASMKKYLDV